MKRQAAFVLTLLVVFIAFAIPSHATSDAHFCTSKGYLAYETHDGDAPGVVGHVLRVVRFEPKRGIYLAGDVTLLEFTVYHLMCSEDRIEISGWRDEFTKYVIEIAGSGEVRSLGPTEYPGRQWSDASDATKDGPAPANLGIFGPHVAPLPLESLDPEHEYQLLRNLYGRQVEQGREWHSKSELVQLDPKGTVLQRFVLYESRRVETSD
jgi:hypothetical protein